MDEGVEHSGIEAVSFFCPEHGIESATPQSLRLLCIIYPEDSTHFLLQYRAVCYSGGVILKEIAPSTYKELFNMGVLDIRITLPVLEESSFPPITDEDMLNAQIDLYRSNEMLWQELVDD